MKTKLRLSILAEKLSVCRLQNTELIPSQAVTGNFFSITKTTDELSVVCETALTDNAVKVEHGWRAFKVEGPLDFSLTGILASIANPLAEANISIFAISTFDTDYILVKEEALERAKEVLGKLFDIID